jgi:hypothetical protein
MHNAAALHFEILRAVSREGHLQWAMKPKTCKIRGTVRTATLCFQALASDLLNELPDGRPSRFFYWDDLPSRRLDPNTLTGEQALERAKAAARGIRNRGPFE